MCVVTLEFNLRPPHLILHPSLLPSPLERPKPLRRPSPKQGQEELRRAVRCERKRRQDVRNSRAKEGALFAPHLPSAAGADRALESIQSEGAATKPTVACLHA